MVQFLMLKRREGVRSRDDDAVRPEDMRPPELGNTDLSTVYMPLIPTFGGSGRRIVSRTAQAVYQTLS